MSQATFEQLGEFLRSRDCFEILTHAYPDGDTLGSGFALALALNQIGKRARVITTGVPRNFEFLSHLVPAQDFETQTVVSVDVADEKLLGDNIEAYEGRIDLCVDHHAINRVNAKQKHVDPHAASNCEILYRLFRFMDIEITADIADCLYTGVSTDTGCFKYGNTTPETLRIAADLIEAGAKAPAINKAMFDTKTRKKLRLEQEIYATIEYSADGRCAVIAAPLELQRRLGVGDGELEGLASIPRSIEGVVIGITLREKTEGEFKISVRSDKNFVNAAEFCRGFGGGGHAEAAGCTIIGSLDEVKSRLRAAVDEVL